MEKIEQPVRTWIVTQSSIELDYIVEAISEGNATFLQLIKALGDFLTAEDSAVRVNGLTLLSEVLARCSDKLNKQSTHVLCTFLLGKLEEESENTVPALKGLNTLSALEVFTSSEVRDTVAGLFKNVNMRAHVQSTRHLVWTLLDSLVARHRETLKDIGVDFLKGYTALAEGEKDPRNLLLAFSIDRVLLLEFEVKPYIEQFYDITFCYFPITFRPPPNDPYGITTADLQHALRSCLNATPFFGPLAMPLFLEKLNAGTNHIKIDTLQTIAACLSVYGQGVCQEHSEKLWSGLKVEIYQPTDDEVQSAALKTTQVLLQTLYPSEEFEGLGPLMLQDCVQTLKEPEKSKAGPALKVVNTLIQATPTLAKCTVEKIVPHFLTLYRDPQETPLRPHILTGLNTVLETILTSVTPSTPDTGCPLTPYKDDVLATFLSGLNQPATLQTSVDGLQTLVQIKKLLSVEELSFVVQNVSEHLLSSGGHVLRLLNTITDISPTTVEELALPVLINQLPDRPPARDDTKAQARITNALAALRTICIHPILFERLVIRLSSKIDLVATTEGTGDMVSAYIHIMLSTLSGLLSEKLEKGHADVGKYVERLVPALYYLFLHSTGEDENMDGVILDVKVVDGAAEIIRLVVSVLPAEKQRIFILSVYAALFEGRLSGLTIGHLVLRDKPSLKLLQTDYTSPYQRLVPLLAAPFIAIRPEVVLPMEDVPRFLTSTLTWALTVEDRAQSEAAAHLVAATLNKHASICQPFIETGLPEFWAAFIEDPAKTAPLRRRGLHLWTWICRALLLRNHPSALPLIRKLFVLFGDEEVNWDAAKAMGTSGSGGGQLLTKRFHATVRLLSVQKFFDGIVHDIVGGHKGAATPRMQSAYLVALACLIKAVPKITYARVMNSLAPLLLQGLDLPDADLRANVIEALLAICPNEPPPAEMPKLPQSGWSIVSEHVGSLISGTLRNAIIIPGQVSSMRLRIASLQLLGALAMTIQYDKVHPHKVNVIRELQKALDDPKRAVRRAAVEARAAWFKASS